MHRCTTQPNRSNPTPGADTWHQWGNRSVTGSSKGIGAGIALRLAMEGAKVVVNYSRNADDADAVVQRIAAAGGAAVAVRANIARPDEIAGLVTAALDNFGRLDILVNNAGVYKVDTLDTLDATTFAEHFDLNVRGLLLTTQAAVRVMKPGAVIVNISSGLAKSPYPMVHVYCATKGAVDTLTRSLAMELGPRGIRVVGVAPGFVATEGNAESAKSMHEFLVSKTPLGRVGQPADIAAAVAWAASTDGGVGDRYDDRRRRGHGFLTLRWALRRLQCSVCSPPALRPQCPLWCPQGLVRRGPMRGADVGSQTAPAVRGAWRLETGRHSVGSRRLNAALRDVLLERPLAGAAHVAERPKAEVNYASPRGCKPT